MTRCSTSSLQRLILAILFLGKSFAEKEISHRPPATEGGFCDQLIRPLGYSCTEHVVQTEDGFLLAVQRIKKSESSRPVFLQHGLFQGGDTWFLNPPEQSLGFIFADQGFDVWVGNVRGTHWSHGHVNLSVRERAFWEWSWQDLTEYDLKCMLKFVYSVTNSKILFVGHSQGTIMGLAALTKPEIVDMVDRAALLSPIAYLNHISSQLVLRAVEMHLDQVLLTMGVHELNFRNDIGIRLLDLLCDGVVDCGSFLSSITGKNCCFNDSRVEYYLKYEPHPSSARNIRHLFQMIRKGTFAKYDYGLWGNLKHYMQSKPPEYDLTAIPKSLPVWVAYGGKDALADPIDVRCMIQSLRAEPETIYLNSYAHIDFIYGVNARSDVYEDLMRFSLSHSQQEPSSLYLSR
ncbi:lipase 1 [Wolffia australiana]